MRRKVSMLTGTSIAFIMAASLVMPASSATLRPCLANHQVKVTNGKATMLLNGRRVPCKVVKKVTPKPSATPSATPSVPAFNNQLRIAGDIMNDIVIRPGLTVTIRNTDAVPHTVVIASEGISVLTPPNDISAFLAPSTPGVYAITTAENPNIKATLTVVK